MKNLPPPWHQYMRGIGDRQAGYCCYTTFGPVRNNLIQSIIQLQKKMNTLDAKFYDCEYRRPKPRNPTYNSNNVFDSINIFTRCSHIPLHLQNYGRYSLTKQVKEENLPSIKSRLLKPSGNFSTILPALDAPKKPRLMSGKDSLYLEMLAEINRSKSSRKNESSIRKNIFNAKPEFYFYSGQNKRQGGQPK